MLHEVMITVRYRPGKPDSKEIPTNVYQIGTKVEDRSNGEPKVTGLPTDWHDDVLVLAQKIGADAVVDALNHGLDLRTRARTRPSSEGGTKTLNRRATQTWLSKTGDQDMILSFLQAGAESQKLANEFLDKMYDDNADEIEQAA